MRGALPAAVQVSGRGAIDQARQEAGREGVATGLPSRNDLRPAALDRRGDRPGRRRSHPRLPRAGADGRRLSDEERRSRRARRNLLLLLIGGAVLIALTVAFGKRPAR